MREIINIVIEADNIITMWHGGRNLESDYLEVKAHKKGRWEHGPGLYLTSHFDRAVQYAKGGGKLYRVSFRPGRLLDEVVVPIDDMIDFVTRNVPARYRRDIIADLRNNMARRGGEGVIAEVLVNLCLNYEALPNSRTDRLRQFLIDHGVDMMKTRYGGRDETVVAIINPRIITHVEAVKVGDVPTDEYVFPMDRLTPS